MLSVFKPFYCTCDMHTHFHRITQAITRGYRGGNGMGRLIEEVYKIIQETTQENKTTVITNENRDLVAWLVQVTCFTGVPGRQEKDKKAETEFEGLMMENFQN